jgi:predicted AAA+ superfamily ATPase
VPLKITLTDLGVRNALFRGAPSLWESAPDIVGPLVETLVQGVLRGRGVQVHFYRDYQTPGNRRSPIEEIDFVLETLDGTVIPLEVKFRRRIDPSDLSGLRRFVGKFDSPFGVLVTREMFACEPEDRVICIPVLEFLLGF